MYTNENVKCGKAPPPPKILKDTYTSFGRLIDPNEVLIRSLQSQGIQQLYSLSAPATTSAHINTNNYKHELKKLNHSILIAYLDLLEVLVKAPNTQIEQAAPVHSHELAEAASPKPLVIIKSLREQKLEDLECLFINMHHLINELRPHQARDSIRCVLQMQRQQRSEIADKFRHHLHTIVDLLKKCIGSIRADGSRHALLLHELDSYVKNAGQLSKSLERLGVSKRNGYHESDVEMSEQEEGNLMSVVSRTSARLTEKTRQVNNGHLKEEVQANKNCDIKDLILCDLIDEFLIKENEF